MRQPSLRIIHETLFDPTAEQQMPRGREHRLPIRRFEQECQFLNTIKHPNVIQYLGMYTDPDTGLPVLLMELMDDSLTHFLEAATQQIPYHIQVNICHDISMALTYLHTNGNVVLVWLQKGTFSFSFFQGCPCGI